MNVFNRFFLWVVLLPAGLYRKMGVNLSHLKAILTTKLIMDDRRPNNIRQAQQKKNQKPVKWATLGTMFMSAVLGCFYLLAFSIGSDYLTQLTIYFSFYIFMLTSTLITDFTSVLIDVRDNMIILPKPVNDKTFVLARLLHILIHVSKLVIPMSVPGMIMMGMTEGYRAVIPFIFLILAATIFTIFLINALYIFILKITTPEKFKNFISYFQIFFAILIYSGYQLVPRLINQAALQGYSISSLKWAWLVPPYWFAASWQYMFGGIWNSPLVIYFLLSLLLPFLSLWVVIKYFAPSFNQKLSMINGSEGEAAPVKGKPVVSTTSAYVAAMSRWLTKSGAERMGFLFTSKITSRSREFKMKVYPTIGYMIVYIFIMFMNKTNLLLSDLQNQSSGKGKFFFVSIIYFGSFLLMMAIPRLMYTDKYKASWIYYITPIQTPGLLLSGALKSAIVKFYFPLVIIIASLAIPLIGPKIIPNLLLGFFNQLLITTLIAYLQMRALPFSVQEENKIKGGSFIRGLFTLSFPLLLAVMHYFVYSMLPVVIILCVLSIIASWLMMDALKNKSWTTVQRKEIEY